MAVLKMLQRIETAPRLLPRRIFTKESVATLSEGRTHVAAAPMKLVSHRTRAKSVLLPGVQPYRKGSL